MTVCVYKEIAPNKNRGEKILLLGGRVILYDGVQYDCMERAEGSQNRGILVQAATVTSQVSGSVFLNVQGGKGKSMSEYGREQQRHQRIRKNEWDGIIDKIEDAIILSLANKVLQRAAIKGEKVEENRKKIRLLNPDRVHM